MNRYGLIQGLLLAFTALIFFKIRQFNALPVRYSNLELLVGTPAVRAARQANADPKILNPYSGGGFKVFPKKDRIDLRPVGSVRAWRPSEPLPTSTSDSSPTGSSKRRPTATPESSPTGSTKRRPTGSLKTRPTAGRRIYYKQDNPEGDTPAEGDSAKGDSAGSLVGDSKEGKDGAVAGGVGPPEIGATPKKELTVGYGDDAHGDHFMGGSGQRETIDPNPKQIYYPSMENLTKVCAGKTTIYNDLKIENWLMRGLSSKKLTDRPFLLDLRREIFEKGDSESCHNLTITDWQAYQDCALRRNQRMEYFIPKYPLQQIVSN